MHIEKELQIIKENAVDVISGEEILKKLEKSRAEGKGLRVKYGADPSAADIHLGHTVPLQKLRQLQDLGHQVIFLIGDFTACIGDPSGVSKTRPPLTKQEVQNNAATYQEQIFKILDRKLTDVVFNSQWCNDMNLSEVIKLASHYTVARMLERDDFALRFRKKEPISIHEFLYPLIQGYDSVFLKADMEVGGTDQRFNFLVARELQRDFGQEPEVLILLPLLEGTDGTQKMSKSLNNYIGISEPPAEIYGKIMSIPDEILPRYYNLLLRTDMPNDCGPHEAKKRLAQEITSIHHGEENARKSEQEFEKVFVRKELPENIPEFVLGSEDLKDGKIWIVELLLKAKLAATRNEARRLIAQGGVKLNNKSCSDPELSIELKGETVIKAGKRHFARIKMEGNHG
jgi:tyrosyl-tRNA synthetase